jgi:hypothetical protein
VTQGSRLTRSQQRKRHERSTISRAPSSAIYWPRGRSQPRSECVACGWSYTPKAEGDDSTRFCSARCREAYDAGFPPHDPRYHTKGNQRWYALPLGREGFKIDCAGCGKRFDSLGLRCCSVECERGLGQKRETERLKVEAGIEFVSKLGPKRKCQTCQGNIPRWRNGRAVSRRTRFCSPRCSRSARVAYPHPSAGLVAETAKKCPENGA